MFQSMLLIAILGIIVAAAAAIWVAGVKLANTTDVLAQRLGFGQALGGVILLAIARRRSAYDWRAGHAR